MDVVMLYRLYGKGGYYVRHAISALEAQGATVSCVDGVEGLESMNDRDAGFLVVQRPQEVYRSAEDEAGANDLISRFCAVVDRLRGLGWKLIWTVHEVTPHEPSEPKGLDESFLRCLVSRCDGVITHSANAAADVRGRLDPTVPIRSVPHGSYIGFYPGETTPRADARAHLGLPAHKELFLAYGRLRAYKGIDDGIEAFKRYNALFPESHLVVAGVPAGRSWDLDAERQRLTSLIDGHPDISLKLEWIEHESLAYYIRSADAVLLPYRRISTSGGLLSAMSLARIAIIPTLGGVPEMADSSSAVLYDPSERDGLLNAMFRFSRLPAKDEMEDRALKRIQLNTWAGYGELFAAFLRELGDLPRT